LSNLVFNREIYINNSFERAQSILDEKSVVLYPFCYVYPSYYDRKPELSVISLFKKEGKVTMEIRHETLKTKIIFSEYIYFIREIENLFELIEKDASSQMMQEKLAYFNDNFLTVDNKIFKRVFKINKKREIESLKISYFDFVNSYKYEIIQKALSFVEDICLRSIPKGMKKIYFSPFGDLNLLPLHALSNGEGDWLIKDYEIAYIPFISLLDRKLQNESNGENLFISTDEFKDEGEQYKTFVDGKSISNIDSTQFKVQVHNQKYNILHLSTHGLSDLDNPLNSHLQFKDSILSLLEIHGLKLDVNLVVLSACETNLSQLKGADEILAFERAFLVAGAKNVITTFTTVNIEQTNDFMESFYKNYTKHKSISKTFQQACMEDIKNGSMEWSLFRFMGV